MKIFKKSGMDSSRGTKSHKNKKCVLTLSELRSKYKIAVYNDCKELGMKLIEVGIDIMLIDKIKPISKCNSETRTHKILNKSNINLFITENEKFHELSNRKYALFIVPFQSFRTDNNIETIAETLVCYLRKSSTYYLCSKLAAHTLTTTQLHIAGCTMIKGRNRLRYPM